MSRMHFFIIFLVIIGLPEKLHSMAIKTDTPCSKNRDCQAPPPGYDGPKKCFKAKCKKQKCRFNVKKKKKCQNLASVVDPAGEPEVPSGTPSGPSPPSGGITWKAEKSLPIPIGECAACGYKGKMIVSGQTKQSVAYVFDGGSWSKINMPIGNNHMAAVQVGSKCYFLGGFNNQSKKSMDTLQIFDFDTNKIEQGNSIPFSSGSGSACAHGGKILFCGGINGSNTVRTCALYNIRDDLWEDALQNEMPFGLNHAAYATVGNVCHIYSGRIGGNRVGNGQNVYLTYDFSSSKWQKMDVPDDSEPRGGMGPAVFASGKLVIIGGELPSTVNARGKTDKDVVNLVDILSVGSGKWTHLYDTDWTVRHGICSAVVGGRIWVAGGGTKAGRSASSVVESLKV